MTRPGSFRVLPCGKLDQGTGVSHPGESQRSEVSALALHDAGFPLGGELGGRRDRRQIAAGEHVAEETNQFLMNEAIRGEYLPAVELEVVAGKVRHAAASLFDQQNAGCRVPGVQIELPEGLEAASRYIGQVERGRAGTPYPMRAQREFLVKVHVGAHVAFAAGKSRSEQRFGQVGYG